MKLISNHTRILFWMLIKNVQTIFKLYPNMRKMARTPEKYTKQELDDYVDLVVDTIIKKCHFQINVHGLENIPADKGVLVCPNHQEKTDIVVIRKSFPRPIGYVIDSFAAKRHFCREICRMVPSITMPKNSMKGMIKAIEKLTDELKNKEDYVIFPEGRYAPDCKHLLPFLGGTFKSALRSHVPIVPTAIINSNHVFDRGASKPYVIDVYYLSPIFYDDYKDMKTNDIAALVQSKVQEVVDKYQR